MKPNVGIYTLRTDFFFNVRKNYVIKIMRKERGKYLILDACTSFCVSDI